MREKLRYILFAAVFLASMPLALYAINYYVIEGLNPFLSLPVMCFCILLFFLGIRWWWRRRARFAPVDCFLVGCMSWLLLGFGYRSFFGKSTVDIQLHDTMFVIAQMQVVLAMTVVFGVGAFIYHLYPKITGRQLEPTMGAIHFWVSFLGSSIVFFVIPRIQSHTSMPRRYLDFETSYDVWHYCNIAFLWTGIAVLAAQLLFVINLVYSGVKGRRV